jgi:hypothetical protein
MLDPGTVNALVTQLKTDPNGGAPQDHFAKFNVLSVVLAVDPSLVTANGPIVGVWGSTNKVGM